MIQPSKKRAVKSGLPPGTLVHIGHKKTDQVFITVIEYDEERFQQREIKQIEECFPLKDKPTITWLNISGIQGHKGTVLLCSFVLKRELLSRATEHLVPGKLEKINEDSALSI